MLTKLIKLLPIEDASYRLRIKFKAFSGRTNPSIQFGATPRLEFIIYSSWEDRLASKCVLSHTKAKQKRAICGRGKRMKKAILAKPSPANIVGDTFGKAGDSGAAVFDKFGIFVGLDSASNTYTGSGFFTAAKGLFADIKRMASAE